MAQVMGALDRFLARAPADANCCLWLADWVLERSGVDPAVGLRDLSADAEARLLRMCGGVLGVIARQAQAAGLVQTAPTDLRAGDIGVVEVQAEDGPAAAGAIFTGRRWMVLASGGLMACDALYPLAVWRL